MATTTRRAGVPPAACGALARRLVPDELWSVAAPLLPPSRARPQGGGRPRADERTVLAAVLFVLASGQTWRAIPACLPVTVPTAHRRFTEWTASGLWSRLPAEMRRRGAASDLVAWVDAAAEQAAARAPMRPAGDRP